MLEITVPVEAIRDGDTVIPGHYSFSAKVEEFFGQIILRDTMFRRGYYFQPGEKVLVRESDEWVATRLRELDDASFAARGKERTAINRTYNALILAREEGI